MRDRDQAPVFNQRVHDRFKVVSPPLVFLVDPQISLTSYRRRIPFAEHLSIWENLNFVVSSRDFLLRPLRRSLPRATVCVDHLCRSPGPLKAALILTVMTFNLSRVMPNYSDGLFIGSRGPEGPRRALKTDEWTALSSPSSRELRPGGKKRKASERIIALARIGESRVVATGKRDGKTKRDGWYIHFRVRDLSAAFKSASYLRNTPPRRLAFRHSGGDSRLCTSATVTLYLLVLLSNDNRPGTEQNTSDGCAFPDNMAFSLLSEGFISETLKTSPLERP